MIHPSSTSIVLPVLSFVLTAAAPLQAANVILNSGFEDPIVGSPGNNFPGSVPNWTVFTFALPCGSGHNIILAGAGYSGGPDVAVDGNQYYDICGAAGYIYQSFTVGSASVVSFGASFSRRDSESGGGNAEIFDATNTVLLFSAPRADVDASESQEIWRVSSAAIPSLAAGSYVLRLNIDNPANADAAFVDVTPIPEPGSALLLAGGLAGALRRRR